MTPAARRAVRRDRDRREPRDATRRGAPSLHGRRRPAGDGDRDQRAAADREVRDPVAAGDRRQHGIRAAGQRQRALVERRRLQIAARPTAADNRGRPGRRASRRRAGFSSRSSERGRTASSPRRRRRAERRRSMKSSRAGWQPGGMHDAASRRDRSAASSGRDGAALIRDDRRVPPAGDPENAMRPSVDHAAPPGTAASARIAGDSAGGGDFLQLAVREEADPASVGGEERRGGAVAARRAASGSSRSTRADVERASARRRPRSRSTRRSLPSGDTASAGARRSNDVPVAGRRSNRAIGGRLRRRAARRRSATPRRPRARRSRTATLHGNNCHAIDG